MLLPQFRGSLIHTDFFIMRSIRDKFAEGFNNATVNLDVELVERNHLYEHYPDRYLLGLKAVSV